MKNYYDKRDERTKNKKTEEKGKQEEEKEDVRRWRKRKRKWKIGGRAGKQEKMIERKKQGILMTVKREATQGRKEKE